MTKTSEYAVAVYKSSRMADTFVYLRAEDSPESLPDALLQRFGEAKHVVEFSLHADRYLAQADAQNVMRAIAEQGFYLQLPPAEDT